ncbi:MAG: hypothetical protein AAGB02_03175 [Pseudomonadota bacterium]
MSFVLADNWVDRATIIAHNEVGKMRAENLKTDTVGNCWRANNLSISGNTVTLDIQASEPEPTQVLFLQRPRYSRRKEKEPGIETFSATDTIEHQLYSEHDATNLLWGSGEQLSGIVKGLGVTGVYLPERVPNVRLWRIIFRAYSRSIAPNDFIEFGRAVAGDPFKFTTAYAAPLRRGGRSNSTSRRPKAGVSVHRRRAPQYRIWAPLFKSIDTDEYESVEDFLLDVGDLTQFLIGLEEDQPHRTWMLGAIKDEDLERYSYSWSRLPMTIPETI